MVLVVVGELSASGMDPIDGAPAVNPPRLHFTWLHNTRQDSHDTFHNDVRS